MPANLESMFYVRETPWHGLGVKVEEALSSEEALRLSGLDWKVTQRPIYTADFICASGNVYTNAEQIIPNYKANVRDVDGAVLGVVTDRYKIVQNEEAFAFTDALIGEGVRYETAGSLQGGRRVWILGKLPENYIIGGERIEPYMVFSNSHDGTAAIKVAMTPIRVVCQNTLNLAISQAKRSWSTKHTGGVHNRMGIGSGSGNDAVVDAGNGVIGITGSGDYNSSVGSGGSGSSARSKGVLEAQKTLGLAHKYMESLGREFDNLSRIKLSDGKVMELINELIPLSVDASDVQKKNTELLRDDVKIRYFEAPDLKVLGKNGYRFINAISDHATHVKPLRETSTYRENLFLKTLEGHPMIDRAYQMLKTA
ncbi:MAG: DUF932 domain-containing protein [Defluviitaleaceae bacterium]|nr:DUF932 domain-containing protein [Defluviitaleaceae bacterium]